MVTHKNTFSLIIALTCLLCVGAATALFFTGAAQPSLVELEQTLPRAEFEKRLTPDQLQCHKRAEDLTRRWLDLLNRTKEHDKNNSYTAEELEELRQIADQFEEVFRKGKNAFPKNMVYARHQACSARWNYIDVLFRSGKREEACQEVPKLRQMDSNELDLVDFVGMSIDFVNKQFRAHEASGLTVGEEADYKFLVEKTGQMFKENGRFGMACDVRVAYARALQASGKADEAIRQLQGAMTIAPQVCLTTEFLQVAQKCKALDNAEFAEAFTKSGGDKSRLATE